MKLNLSTPILGIDGKQINAVKEVFVIRKNEAGKDEFEKDEKGQEIILEVQQPDQALTIKKVIITALLTDTKESTADEKASKFALFFRIESSTKDIIELSAEEVSLSKKHINTIYSTLVSGRACRILENK